MKKITMCQYRLLLGRPIRFGFNFDKKMLEEFRRRSIIFENEQDMHTKIHNSSLLFDKHKEILRTTGFYADLPLIDGFLDAFHMLDSMVDCDSNKIFEIYFVTTPSFYNETCLQDKFNDLKKYFKFDILKRAFFCFDKTIVDIDILVDDKLVLDGANGSSKFSEPPKNNMSFNHIRFVSPLYIHAAENIPPELLDNNNNKLFHLINNWTDETYLSIIERVASDMGLLGSIN